MSYIAPLLLVLFIASTCLQAQSGMPQMKSVEPVNAKAGDVLTVTGENLDAANVAKVYLTDGKNDVEVVIEGQEATALKFKVPENVKPGRLALMILTKGKEPKLIEQPVKVTID
ncbi:MAG TPA: IPT/TIG domain-containing protein [Bryobacteraceae bacterium]|nr:IPT/TIG domain-containing protein [Bryobacteraceae bacterium]HPQ15819.1 IPT/TIG domain-containing protein [Bryobacteraceae bacterium]HPU73061.1 IPT/TIG domain-containing protein [Bryobacteraceae bacterium]